MKTRRCFVILILIMCMICMCVACSKIQNSIHPELFQKLSSLMGAPKETFLKELELDEDDLVKDVGFAYKLPVSVEYHGITFDIQVFFDQPYSRLYEVCFVADLKGDAEDTAQKILTVAQNYKTNLGDTKYGVAPDSGEHACLADYPLVTLTGKITGVEDNSGAWYGYGSTNTWVLEKASTDYMEEYLRLAKEYAAVVGDNLHNYSEIPDLELDFTIFPQEKGHYTITLSYHLQWI